MSVICPTILASDEADYAKQIRKITPFAERIQIDLMDGEFASPASVNLNKIWWPKSIEADIHLMYKDPESHLEQLLRLKPHMVIVHAEVLMHHMHFAAKLHAEGIKVGLAVLPDTQINDIEQILSSFDHLLIFSGDLGKFGGKANLNLTKKANQAREHHPNIEIGWDGGINDGNAKELSAAGIEVLNVGGFIQHAQEAEKAFKSLQIAIN